MSRFAIGQQVMCIRQRWKGSGRFNRPQFLNIYTVRAHCPCSDVPAILLQELHNPEVRFVRTHKVGEASFAERHFAPLEPLTKSAELEAVA